MLLKEIANLIECNVLTSGEGLEKEYSHAFGSDLMSDVLAYVEDDTILLTGLINHQVIRTAEMLDLRAIVFVRGKVPSDDVIELAKEQEIVLLTTNHSMYTAAGILYTNGIRGLSI